MFAHDLENFTDIWLDGAPLDDDCKLSREV